MVRPTGKKFPIIHSKMVARISSTGPTKKNMPATPARPAAPAQPIKTILNVNVLITKPTKPIGVGFANPDLGTLGVRYSFSKSSGEMVMPEMVFVWVRRRSGSSAMWSGFAASMSMSLLPLTRRDGE